MASITNKRADYNDAFERLAEQEAQREADKLRQAAINQQPDVIDLDSDSDDGGAQTKKRSMIPSPPRLSNYRY